MMKFFCVAILLASGSQAVTHNSFLTSVKGKTVPALQPHDTYDEDFPITNRGLTPSQLRYKAQADYAKAVAEMKEEEAEALAAKNAAKAAAKAAAERAKKAVEAAKAGLEAANKDKSSTA